MAMRAPTSFTISEAPSVSLPEASFLWSLGVQASLARHLVNEAPMRGHIPSPRVSSYKCDI